MLETPEGGRVRSSESQKPRRLGLPTPQTPGMPESSFRLHFLHEANFYSTGFPCRTLPLPRTWKMRMINDKPLLFLSTPSRLHSRMGRVICRWVIAMPQELPNVRSQTKDSQPPFSVLGPQRHSPKKTSFMSCPMFAFSKKKTSLKGTQEMGVLESLPTCLRRRGDWKRPRVAQRAYHPEEGVRPLHVAKAMLLQLPWLAGSALRKCAFYLCFPCSRNPKGKRGAPRNRLLRTGVPNQLVRPSCTITGLWRPFGPIFYCRYEETEALRGNVICPTLTTASRRHSPEHTDSLTSVPVRLLFPSWLLEELFWELSAFDIAIPGHLFCL